MAIFKAQHNVEQLQQDTDKSLKYDLSLKGNNLNEVIDAATPLLGMILRIQDLATPIINAEHLYHQVVTDIQTIEEQLQGKGYDLSSVITFRYVLCAFIDECIMSSESKLAEFWSNKSLLIHFHNEGWGGERVFQITERLMSEPNKYQDLLAFIYLCFGLGFRGRYKIHNTDNDDFEKLFHKIGAIVLSFNDKPHSKTLYIGESTEKNYFLPKQFKAKYLIITTIAILATAYLSYWTVLNTQSISVLEQLSTLLQ